MKNPLIDCLLTTWRIFGTRKANVRKSHPALLSGIGPSPELQTQWSLMTPSVFVNVINILNEKSDSLSMRYKHFLTYGRKFVSACSSFVAFLRDHTDEQYTNGCILSRICGVFFFSVCYTLHMCF